MRGDQSVHVERQCVGGDNLESARIVRGDLRKRGETSLVAFHGDYAGGTRGQQGAGKAAGARTDLDDRRVGKIAGGARNAARQVQVEKKILSERFLRRQPMSRDDLAERRKSVAHVGDAVSARRFARRRAATRLEGLATPLPAISKAVP